MRIPKSFLLGVALVLALAQNSATANVITIVPTNAESTYYRTADDTNYYVNYWGWYAGNVGHPVSYWRFFETFNLPAYEPGSVLSSAIVSFSTTRSGGSTNHALGVFGTAGWTTNFAYGKSPKEQSAILGKLQLTTGGAGHETASEVDVTDFMKSVYSGHDSVGFEVRSLYERTNWDDMVQIIPQSLSLTFTRNVSDPHPIPEPTDKITFALGLALLGASARLRRTKA